jgi:transcriptional regulator with XRE-family HTH domain
VTTSSSPATAGRCLGQEVRRHRPESTVSEGASPVVARRRLQVELRRARQQAALTQEAVAAAMDWSLSKIIRIECGAATISTNNLKALLRLYHVEQPERVEELVSLTRLTRQQSWWSKYKDLEYGVSVSALRQDESLLIPGLLQTLEYASALLRQYGAHHPGWSQDSPRVITLEVIKDRVELRMARQQLLDRPDSALLYSDRDEFWDSLNTSFKEATDVINLPASIAETAAPESGLSINRDQVILHATANSILISFVQPEPGNWSPDWAQRLAFFLAIAQLRLQQRLAAEVRRPLRSLKPVPSSRQVSARDQMIRSGRPLRGPTSARVPCPTRGMAAAA